VNSLVLSCTHAEQGWHSVGWKMETTRSVKDMKSCEIRSYVTQTFIYLFKWR